METNNHPITYAVRIPSGNTLHVVVTGTPGDDPESRIRDALKVELRSVEELHVHARRDAEQARADFCELAEQARADFRELAALREADATQAQAHFRELKLASDERIAELEEEVETLSRRLADEQERRADPGRLAWLAARDKLELYRFNLRQQETECAAERELSTDALELLDDIARRLDSALFVKDFCNGRTAAEIARYVQGVVRPIVGDCASFVYSAREVDKEPSSATTDTMPAPERPTPPGKQLVWKGEIADDLAREHRVAVVIEPDGPDVSVLVHVDTLDGLGAWLRPSTIVGMPARHIEDSAIRAALAFLASNPVGRDD